MASKEQIKRIYALGAKCGLLDRSLGSEDNLHLWVKQFSLKDHISELTEKQADFIILRLQEYCDEVVPPKPIEVEPITGAQQSFCFRLAYKLASISPSEADVRERLRGVIEKVVGRKVDSERDIFHRVSRSEGAQVIEMLKRMIRNEEQKIKRARAAQKRGDGNADVGSGGGPPP